MRHDRTRRIHFSLRSNRSWSLYIFHQSQNTKYRKNGRALCDTAWSVQRQSLLVSFPSVKVHEDINAAGWGGNRWRHSNEPFNYHICPCLMIVTVFIVGIGKVSSGLLLHFSASPMCENCHVNRSRLPSRRQSCQLLLFLLFFVVHVVCFDVSSTVFINLNLSETPTCNFKDSLCLSRRTQEEIYRSWHTITECYIGQKAKATSANSCPWSYQFDVLGTASFLGRKFEKMMNPQLIIPVQSRWSTVTSTHLTHSCTPAAIRGRERESRKRINEKPRDQIASQSNVTGDDDSSLWKLTSINYHNNPFTVQRTDWQRGIWSVISLVVHYH